MRANVGIWTRGLFLTKETLYPWATSAFWPGKFNFILHTFSPFLEINIFLPLRWKIGKCICPELLKIRFIEGDKKKLKYNKSGRPGSNRRHSAWKADALPTELLPLKNYTKISKLFEYFKYIVGRAGFEPAKVKPTDLQSALVGRLSISPKAFLYV